MEIRYAVDYPSNLVIALVGCGLDLQNTPSWMISPRGGVCLFLYLPRQQFLRVEDSLIFVIYKFVFGGPFCRIVLDIHTYGVNYDTASIPDAFCLQPFSFHYHYHYNSFTLHFSISPEPVYTNCSLYTQSG